MKKLIRAVSVSSLIALLLAACGAKGPLFLPADRAPVVVPEAPPQDEAQDQAPPAEDETPAAAGNG
ncbi:LPS translocon maturation chaperone LptM [Pseudoxanthomonas mexicana]|uniref:LPS translocon maturation chaperone LptM n=1 Tax=Pseudoxanthomonas mexicana TaxID=128785 RepID=UPI00398AF4AF